MSQVRVFRNRCLVSLALCCFVFACSFLEGGWQQTYSYVFGPVCGVWGILNGIAWRFYA